LVRRRGLEPPRPKTLAPKASASTNSATAAHRCNNTRFLSLSPVFFESNMLVVLWEHMSKVAQYLNEHLLGEVTTSGSVRERFARDGSLLKIIPDMVVHPRSTSDIRKVARFSWQLSEKGHILPVTARGAGTDQTGGAIGSGVIINMLAHMNEIYEIDPKQKLIRLQPGVTFKTLNNALGLYGLEIPSYPASQDYSTIGGAIANNASGVLSGKYGATGEWVSQLEVVLSNGDIIQTGRISKRDLGRKRGLQNFEGEIYRSLDDLLTENAQLIDSLYVDVQDNAGYNITQVKRKDGSIDLTPLFIGSQGTLGIISEIIMNAKERTTDHLVGALAFRSYEALRDALDQLRPLTPAVLELIDGKLFETAIDKGKKYPFYTDVLDGGEVVAVVLFEFDNHNGRAKKNIGKKIANLFKDDNDVEVALADSPDTADELRALRNVTTLTVMPDKDGDSTPPVFDGVYIPPERFEDFANSIAELEKKHHVSLALYGHADQSVYYARPQFNLTKVSDRQRMIKLLGDWSAAVVSRGGHLVAEAGEGRIKAPFVYARLDDDIKELYESIRAIFDPQNILNTGVKQSGDLKQLVSALRTDYDGGDFAEYAPSN
jgi:FAD/FMN-containing dehydrogenase